MSWANWFTREAPAPVSPVERWIVLDVETSGLDLNTAKLLAIACVALRVDWPEKRLNIIPGDSFEVVIKPHELVQDKDNILIHGIGMQRQAEGLPASQALPMLQEFIGNAPLLAFHAHFDKTLLVRDFTQELNKTLPNPWLDIEKLCSVMHPVLRNKSLDDWLTYLDITCAARHEAAADCMAESEVLQCIWPALVREMGANLSWHGLKKIERLDRWMNR